MAKEFWLNLPVKDVKKSRDFFTAIGFKLNVQHGNTASSASFLIGDKNIVLMLFDEATFKSFINGNITDTKQSTEILLSIDAQSKAEVDEMVQKVIDAGGSSNHKPYEMQGRMYGCIFSDPDGHRWNILYMDYSQM